MKRQMEKYVGYIVSHTHSDLCWPNTPEVCINACINAINKMLKIVQEYPSYKYTMEHSLFLKEFLKRHPEKKELIRKAIRENNFECSGFYSGPWESALGGEGLIRELYFGKRWLKEYLGAKVSTVWNVDVAGHTLQLPQILAKAGIKGFVISAGCVDSTKENPYVLHYTRGPYLFRWQAPDGSEVITWVTPWGYGATGEGGIGLRDKYEQAIERLPKFIEDIKINCEEHNLPKIAFITDGTDIQLPSPELVKNVTRWNEEKRYPQLKIVSSDELFTAVENENLPIYGGEMPSFWDGVQVVGYDCLMTDRRLDGRLEIAEKLCVIVNLLTPDFVYPKQELDDVWEGRLYVEEHNWGGTNGEESNRVKTEKIQQAYSTNEKVLNQAIEKLSSRIKFRNEGIPIVVFNPLSWERKDIATCILNLPEKQLTSLGLKDNHNNFVPFQITEIKGVNKTQLQVKIIFEAEVPAIGYAAYYFVSKPKKFPSSFNKGDYWIENECYKITVNPNTGGVSSILDKKNKCELVDNGKFTANEILGLGDDGVDNYQQLTNEVWLMRNYPSKINIEEGIEAIKLIIEGEFIDSYRKQEIILYRNLDKIDLNTYIEWKGQKNLQLRILFPFNFNINAFYEVPFGYVKFGEEHPYAVPWPYGRIENYSLRSTKNWVSVSDSKFDITLATECNLTDLKDQTSNPIPTFLIQPLLLRTVKSCGDPNLYYTQEGSHYWKFSLKTYKANNIVSKTKFGWEHNIPLISYVATPDVGNGLKPFLTPDQFSFCQISPENVILSAMKIAEDGQGIILRFYELEGKDTLVKINFDNCFKPNSAFLTNIIEEDIAPILLEKNSLSFKINKFGIETIRLEISAS